MCPVISIKSTIEFKTLSIWNACVFVFTKITKASKSQFQTILSAIGEIRMLESPAASRAPLALEDVQPDLSDDSSDTGFWKAQCGIKPRKSPVKKFADADGDSTDDEKPIDELDMLHNLPQGSEDSDEKPLLTPTSKIKKSPGKVICVPIDLDSCDLKTKMYLNLAHGCMCIPCTATSHTCETLHT